MCYNNVTLTAEEDGFVGVFRKARIYFRVVSPFRAVCFSAQTAAAFRTANSRLDGRVVCVFRRAEIPRLNAWTEILRYVAGIYAEKRWSTINIGDLSSSIFFLFDELFDFKIIIASSIKFDGISFRITMLFNFSLFIIINFLSLNYEHIKFYL